MGYFEDVRGNYNLYWDYLNSQQYRNDLLAQRMCLISAEFDTLGKDVTSPFIGLNSFLLEAGAVACPFEIYQSFVGLYFYGRSDDVPRNIYCAPQAQFWDDNWLLLTKTPEHQLPELAADDTFGQKVIIGYDVSIDKHTMDLLGGTHGFVSDNPMRNGTVGWLGSFGANCWAEINRPDGRVTVYGVNQRLIA